MKQLEEITTFGDQLTSQLQWVNNTITDLRVSFMNSADMTVVITVIANFLIQIILDL
jgi:hypothetical protein